LLREGADADIAIIDPERRWTISAASLHSRSTNTPWLHKEVRGKALMTIVAGQIVYEA
jgi:dihydroorotase